MVAETMLQVMYVLQYYDTTDSLRAARTSALKSPGIKETASRASDLPNKKGTFWKRSSISDWKALAWSPRSPGSNQREPLRRLSSNAAEFIASLNVPSEDDVRFVPDVRQSFITLVDMMREMLQQIVDKLAVTTVSYSETTSMDSTLVTIEQLLRRTISGGSVVQIIDAIACGISKRDSERIEQDILQTVMK